MGLDRSVPELIPGPFSSARFMLLPVILSGAAGGALTNIELTSAHHPITRWSCMFRITLPSNTLILRANSIKKVPGPKLSDNVPDRHLPICGIIGLVRRRACCVRTALKHPRQAFSVSDLCPAGLPMRSSAVPLAPPLCPVRGSINTDASPPCVKMSEFFGSISSDIAPLTTR